MARNPATSRIVAWGAGLLLVVAVITAIADFVVERRATAEVGRQRAIILHVEQVLSTMKDAETGQRGYLLVGDPLYLEPYHMARAAIGPELEALRAELGARSTLLEELATKRLDSAQRGIVIHDAQGDAAAVTAVRTGHGKGYMDALRAETAALQRDAERSTRRTQDSLLLLSSALRGVSLLATLLGFAGIAGVALRRWRAQLASKILLQGVLDNAPVGLGFLDAALRPLQLNRALSTMSERALGLVVGEPITVTLPDIEQAAARLGGAAGGGLVNTDVVVPTRDETRAAREYQVALYPLESGKVEHGRRAPDGIGMVVTDVTHRRRAERWLRESEERFRTLTQASSAIIWTTGPTGAFTAPQPDWDRFTGQTSEATLGWGWLEAVHPDDREATSIAFAAAVASCEPLAFEHRLRRADGLWRHMELSAAPLLEPSGVREWVGTHTDITARKEAQIELAAARDAADAANRAKSMFLANMSHELRTPLSAVIGYSEMLEEELADLGGAEALSDLGKIQSNARHLLGLINDVLDLSKIEANRMDVALDTFDVHALVTDVAATVEGLVRQKNNRFTLRGNGPDLGGMRTDAVKLRQCLVNLLSNAGKFTTAGEVTLAVRREARAGGDWFVFTVTDTGIGMTPDQLERLFTRFTQADETTTRRFGGSGLGLAISRAFARLLGGDIAVTSEPGSGSVFTLSLPADAAPPVPAPHHPTEPREDARTRDLVLVIDDEHAQRDLMTRFLSRLGFAVATASDGAAGLVAARRLRPRVVLLDVMMPEMGGWSVLSAMKDDPDLLAIPVVMVTFADDHGLAASLGAADHVDKPVDWTRLRSVMARFHDDAGDVLVVDDDAGARSRLRLALERDGWAVREAGDGEEALACIRTARPRTIFLDLSMPVMDGFAFLDALRGTPEGADIPVIVLTARDVTAAERARLVRADRIIEKGSASLAAIAGHIRTQAPPDGPAA